MQPFIKICFGMVCLVSSKGGRGALESQWCSEGEEHWSNLTVSLRFFLADDGHGSSMRLQF